MNRWLKISIALIALVAISVGISAIWWARDGGTGRSAIVYVTPANQRVNAGGEVTVKVEVEPRQVGISAGEIHLRFDPDAVEVERLEPGYFFGATPLVGFKEIDEEAGILGYSMARVGNTTVPTSSGTFAVVKFNVLESAEPGSYALRLQYVCLEDENFERIEEINIKSGSLDVQ